jgi:hypothetical protein
MTTIFTYAEGSVLVRLLIAHILTDFLLQTSNGIADKKSKLLRGRSFWLHGMYTGIAVIVLTWDQFAWLPIGILLVSHMLIDYLKIIIGKKIGENGNKQQLWLFITDQLLHIAILITIWLMMIHGFAKGKALLVQLLPDYRMLLRVLTYLIVVGPVTYLIRFLTLKWSDEVTSKDESLEDAGKWIGILERIIVVTLVFIEQYTAIGFLATTKSILRLIDKPETGATNKAGKTWSSRKHTEYVLIGTFLSFGSALLTAIIINRLLKF